MTLLTFQSFHFEGELPGWMEQWRELEDYRCFYEPSREVGTSQNPHFPDQSQAQAHPQPPRRLGKEVLLYTQEEEPCLRCGHRLGEDTALATASVHQLTLLSVCMVWLGHQRNPIAVTQHT